MYATTAFDGRVRDAARRLMAMQNDADRVRISVPVIYPSGATSTVEVSVNGSKCFVSDMGIGHTEALLANAEEFYDIQANRAAERFGIGYDGQSIFALWAPVDRMESAIAMVANASVQAASLAILKATEDRDVRRNDELYDRVRSIFKAADVQKTAELPGKNATWKAHNVVFLPSRQIAVFEFVSQHPNSISNKFMMFSDLVSSEHPPSLISVVKSVAAVGMKGAMLADVSNVIELTAPTSDFEKFARAA
jgi:hypothetical protein